MSKTKITVTIDEMLVEELNRFSERLKEPRSQLVEEAIRFWQRCQIEQELIEGYRAMSKEDVETAEACLSAGLEVLT